MALFQSLVLASGQIVPSADSWCCISSSFTCSSLERSASTHFRRSEQSPRVVSNFNKVSAQLGTPFRSGEELPSGVPNFISFSAQVRPQMVCRASLGGEGEEKVEESDGYRQESADGEDRAQWDVTSNCVKPVFRATPLVSLDLDSLSAKKAHILFLSEGNVCRSIYAEAIFNDLLRQHGLQDLVSCASKATRDYNVGEIADPRAVMVAEEYGLELPEGKVATVFDCSTDIVMSDLVLVMDKFTASDALKEVTVYEIVNKDGKYSSKVRRLGEFCRTQQLEDIEDPLYGNMGGEEETELVRQVYAEVRDSCEGLMEYILEVKASLEESESLRDGLARGLGRMDALNWLAPPMLSKV
ncbi:unnamed protein product [Calypogeia fissa]